MNAEPYSRRLRAAIIADRYPVSDEQEARLERDRRSHLQGRPPYRHHESAVLHLTGPLDEVALQAALGATVRRHTALRLRIEFDDPGWSQVATDAVDVPLDHVDLHDLADAARDAVLRDVIAARTHAPFDHARPPLMRATLVRVDERTHALILVVEHLICDGWSLGILLRDLGAAYTWHRTLPASGSREAAPVQFHHYVAWSLERLRGPLGARLERHWLARLGGADPAPHFALPFAKRPSAADRRLRAETVHATVSPSLAHRVEAVARANGMTPFMLWAGALQAFLFRVTGQRRLALPAPVAGRHWPSLDRSVGWFATRVALVAELADGLSAAAVRREVHASALDAYAHQDLPYARLLRVAHAAGTHRRAETYDADVTINFVPESLLSARGTIRFHGLVVRQEDPPRHMPRSTLAFTLGRTAAATTVAARFDTSELTRAQALIMVDDYFACLDWLTRTGRTPLGHVPLSILH